MNTSLINNYIDKNIKIVSEKETFFNKAYVWIHEHPDLVKTIEYAGMAFGTTLATLGTAGFLLLCGSSALLIAPITLCIGGIIALASLTAYIALDILVPPHHDMRTHAFTPATCEGGSLFYQGDVPILSLDADRPYIAGKAQGLLLGPQLSSLLFKFNLVDTCLFRLSQREQVKTSLQELKEKIPEEYCQEMQGLADGINAWNEKNCWLPQRKVSVDDILLLHLMPDMLHYSPFGFKPNFLSTACTAIVDRDQNQGITFARNMDWPAFGVLGAQSLIIHRKRQQEGKHSTVEVGVPGFVGTLTGMNSQGLSLAMNVCDGNTTKARGMPAAFFNRFCLERAANLEEFQEHIQRKTPLGPYHLTVADRDNAASFHFYQIDPNFHIPVVRQLQGGDPLTTLNCNYSINLAMTNHRHHGAERAKNLRQFYLNKPNPSERAQHAEDALSLPFVNNWETTHRVLMQPRTKTFKVAFNNGYAGKDQLHNVDTSGLI